MFELNGDPGLQVNELRIVLKVIVFIVVLFITFYRFGRKSQ